MQRAFLIAVISCLAAPFTSTAQANRLEGVIDCHVHAPPDSTLRSIDALDLTRLAMSRGMHGFVLKNHYEPTASPI
jgi:hypothetical protein